MSVAEGLLPDDEAAHESSGGPAWLTEKLIFLSFVAAMLIVVMIAVLGALELHRSEESSRWTAHTYLVLRTLEQAQSGLFDSIAETRAYVITGGAASLDLRQSALSEMESRLQNARELTADNPKQQLAIAELERMVDARVDLDRELIVAAQADGMAAAQKLMQARADDDLMRRLRSRFDTVRALELELLESRVNAEQEGRRRLVWLAGALLIAVIVTVLTGLSKLRRELTQRRALTDLLRANRGFLAAILDNLPALVFVKDVATRRFLSVNRAAEMWLGRTRGAIVGRSARDLMAAEEASGEEKSDRQALEQADVLHIPEDRRTDCNGVTRTFATKKLLVRDEAGRPNYIVGISHDISERVAQEMRIRVLNSDLESQRRALEAANKELESFSYSVSHDLRSPLRAIDGFSLMLYEDCGDRLDDEGRRYLETIRSSTRRMSQLIDDLLEFSKLGRKSLISKPVDMHALATMAVQEALQGVDASQQRITIDPLPAAVGDPSLLAQVWSNLVSNAVKYSGKTDAPAIHIGASRQGDEFSYYVRDNGAGFDMKYAHKLFGVFQRLHAQDEFPGTGVGLAIVHRVVTRHGGRVWAESAPGRGATFHFALPIKEAA